MTSEKLPKLRSSDIVVQAVEGELVVYDVRTHEAHSLDAVATAIWLAHDGTRDLVEVARHASATSGATVDAAVVAATIGKFAELGLTESEPAQRREGVSRRAMMRSLGKAAMVALPVIVTLSVPPPAAAGSLLPSGSPCSDSAQCASGICMSGSCL